MSPEGQPIQMNAMAIQAAAAQNAAGMLGRLFNKICMKGLLMKYLRCNHNAFWHSGNSVTIMSPDGTPVQINSSALQNIPIQSTAGILGRYSDNMIYY